MSTDESFLASLHRDCRQFRPERPCAAHKLRGKICSDCDEYDRVHTRICIVKLAATGDVLRTTSFLPALRRKYPSAWVHWLTKPAAADLFRHNEFVDVLSTTESSLPAELAQTPFDLVLCPDADLATAALAASVPLREGGRRIGFGIEDGHVLPLNAAAAHWYAMGISDSLKKANRESYQDLVGAALELETPVQERPVLRLSEDERAEARRFLADLAPDAEPGRLIGLNTGAGSRWPQKQWTLHGQCELIQLLAAEGRPVLLLGGPDEAERHGALRAQCAPGACIDAGTDNPLRRFAARVDLCEAVVTGDTMALHIAAALEKGIVALFGPTSSAEIEVYGRGEKLFTEELDCLGCYSSCDKDPNCQDLIPASRVHEALHAVLSGAR